MKDIKAPREAALERQASGFGVVAGVFFFLVIIKLGDPVIISTDEFAPASVSEVIFGPWPMAWGYWLLAPMIILGLALTRWKGIKFRPALMLPLAWLLWQFIAAPHSVDSHLTTLTLRHFTACVALFYLGYFALNGIRWPWPFLAGLALAFCWIVHSGIDQHFGGLEATRQYIHSVYGAGWAELAANKPDFAKRIESNRIFATFVYPNALAGGMLLLLPMTLVFLWQITPKAPLVVRWGFVLILAGCGLGILYWSGSKAGWLLAVAMGMVMLFHSRLPLRWRVGLAGAFVVIGLAGFAIRYSRYFERGATSVSARFDYWKAACQTIKANPVFGTGPGTFSRPYARLKDPRSEMARLCHNDYLEQGSDSGVVGMITYSVLIFGSVYRLYRYRILDYPQNSTLLAAISLGIIGLCCHSFVEYHLYIPALAWPLFFLLGWLWSVE